MGGLLGLPVACLFAPVVGILIIFSMIRRVFGFGGGWGGSMFPGGYDGSSETVKVLRAEVR